VWPEAASFSRFLVVLGRFGCAWTQQYGWEAGLNPQHGILPYVTPGEN